MPTKKSTEVKGVNLLIIRDTFSDISTIGELFVNGERICDTLELPYKKCHKRLLTLVGTRCKRPFIYIISQRQYRQRH